MGVAVALAVQATCGKADLEVRAPNACRNHRTYGGFPKLGVSFWGFSVWGPHNKDYDILGSILGSPYLGNYPLRPRLVEAVNEIPLPRAE